MSAGDLVVACDRPLCQSVSGCSSRTCECTHEYDLYLCYHLKQKKPLQAELDPGSMQLASTCTPSHGPRCARSKRGLQWQWGAVLAGGRRASRVAWGIYSGMAWPAPRRSMYIAGWRRFAARPPPSRSRGGDPHQAHAPMGPLAIARA